MPEKLPFSIHFTEEKPQIGPAWLQIDSHPIQLDHAPLEIAMSDNPPLFEPDPQAQPWVQACMHWLDAGFDPDSPLLSQLRLRPPDETLWSLQLTESLLQFLASRPPLFPSPEPLSQHTTDPDNTDPDDDQATIARSRLQKMILSVAQWQLRALHEFHAEQPDVTLIVAEQMGRLYQATYGWKLPLIQGPILVCLSVTRSDAPLQLLTELLVTLPPLEWSATAQALGPLVSHGDWNQAAIFPRLLDGLQHPSTIASILDLTNYGCRSGLMQEHPAKPLLPNLLSLLSGVVGRLSLLEEDPNQFGSSVAQVQRILDESLALCIALCDAVSWMNDPTAIGKLNQALALSHRRVKVEAACALARLGEPSGRETLIELAADPVSRLRAIKYAEELGFEDAIDEQWKAPTTLAEAELAAWLALPSQMGLPPHHMELVDERTLYWPGYDDPQNCYLFRYEYRFPDSELSNIGIAGPVVHSFAADLAELPEDDIYAAFAGWTAEHDDIFEVAYHDANPAQRQEIAKMESHLEHEGFCSIQPLFLGFFVGERACLAQATKNDTEGIVVTDGLETLWLPTQSRIRPLGPLEVYSIYKGRKLLRTFNS